MAKISVALILVLFATLFTFSEATPLQQPETKGVSMFSLFQFSKYSLISTFQLCNSDWCNQPGQFCCNDGCCNKGQNCCTFYGYRRCTFLNCDDYYKIAHELNEWLRNTIFFKILNVHISQHIVNFYKDFILFWIFIDIGNKSVLHPKKICCIVAPTSFHIYLSTFQKFYRKVYISWYKNGTYLLDQINLQKMI